LTSLTPLAPRTPAANPTPSERTLGLWLALAHFLLLGGYYAMRPVRDEVAANLRAVESDISIGDLWTAVFFVNLALAPIYAAFVSSSSRRRLLSSVLGFFALCAVGFAIAFESTSGETRLWADRIFYVWASVFVMFVISSFWSFASDLCSMDRAKRIFGLVAAAGTAGQILGSTVTRELSSEDVRASIILAVVVALLVAAAVVLWWIDRAFGAPVPVAGGSDASTRTGRDDRIGGTFLSGFTAVVNSPYLMAISGFLLLMTMSSTVFYYVQSDLVGAAFDDRSERTEFLANLDVWTGWITLALQGGVVAFLMRRIGLGLTLAGLPLVALICVGAVWTAFDGADPNLLGEVATANLGLLAVALVAQRVARHALAKPARETLFTLVSRDERFKSKNFMDTAVYRGGDVLWARVFESLMGAGHALANVLAMALPALALWGVGAVALGRSAKRRSDG
jgi:ATP:ADP antiporter, AAA family